MLQRSSNPNLKWEHMFRYKAYYTACERFITHMSAFFFLTFSMVGCWFCMCSHCMTATLWAWLVPALRGAQLSLDMPTTWPRPPLVTGHHRSVLGVPKGAWPQREAYPDPGYFSTTFYSQVILDGIVKKLCKHVLRILLAPRGVLAHGSKQAWPSARPQIITSGIFCSVHVLGGRVSECLRGLGVPKFVFTINLIFLWSKTLAKV